MAYSANTDVEAALGLEAGTLTAAQDTMITLLITLADDYIDGVAGCSFSSTPRGIKFASAQLAADLWRFNQGKIDNVPYSRYDRLIYVAMNQEDADWNIYLQDRVDPFDEDSDV